jgi:hypothetical protein
MLGNQIVESKGKRILRRVLSANPPTVEVSFEETGSVLGHPCNGLGTYASVLQADGTLHGNGQGVMITQEGEAVTWTGTGFGRLGPGGAVSYRGMLFFRTASKNLAGINGACGAFEHEVDSSGNTTSKIWEWK